MMLLDASFLIALVRERDENHARATYLQKEIVLSSEELLVTEVALSEFLTFLCKHDGPVAAAFEGTKLLGTQNVNFVSSGAEDARQAIEIMKKYKLGSYADALLVHNARIRKINKLVAFDSDFDHIDGIKRIC